MNVSDLLKKGRIYLDGGFGTYLQKEGLKPGEHTEEWNLTHPEVVQSVHKKYFDAGSNIVCANTFGANRLNFGSSELERIVFSAIKNARLAAEASFGTQEKFVALDIGPLGKLLKPFGDLEFEEAVSIFAETVTLGEKFGADLIIIETMNDCYETKAALLAAKENSNLPVFVTNAYSEDEKLITGATPEAMVALLEGMGADAVGANCSLGPRQLKNIAKRILDCASVPVIIKPNAGMPKIISGKTVFDVSPEEFGDDMKEIASLGVSVLGGCCGTDDEYIRLMIEKTWSIPFKRISPKDLTVVSSYTKAVYFGKKPIAIGERINPTGKKRFKQALVENDIDYILKEGISEQQNGADILDVNVGIPQIDEKALLSKTVFELQSVVDLPLQLDTSDIKAMESALRLYNGKAMINSVNGKKESMEAVFPLVKKYGGVVVALTLDENGIPETAEERVKIAEKILKTASRFGIEKKNIVFDTLVMTVSTNKNAARVTLDAMREIKNRLGCHTILGISNVSFGLPERGLLNSSFLLLAFENGLSGAILNPNNTEMKKALRTYCALSGLDDGFSDYISFCSEDSADLTRAKTLKEEEKDPLAGLKLSIKSGLKEETAFLSKELLSKKDGLEIVNEVIIPALDEVGKDYEEKRIYLPQLLMSAEAAKAAFEEIKKKTKPSENESGDNSFSIVLATVKGDIHDIGKNIVKLLLENYGYKVIDLGKDVDKERISDAALKNSAGLVGLSALMTTTVPAMEETIELLKSTVPNCKVVVGGAVLTKEYAEKIGADKYSKDAMETVRYAEKLKNNL